MKTGSAIKCLSSKFMPNVHSISSNFEDPSETPLEKDQEIL